MQQGSQSVWTSWPGGIGYPTAIPLKGGRKTRKGRKASKKTRKMRKGTRRMRGGVPDFSSLSQGFRSFKEELRGKLGLNLADPEKKPNGVNEATWKDYLKQKKEYNYIVAVGKLADHKRRKKANRLTQANLNAIEAFERAVEPKYPGAVGNMPFNRVSSGNTRRLGFGYSPEAYAKGLAFASKKIKP